ncbi:probable LRR receptor-like serine/threonine-protein kinase At2g16250 isoform X2 [Olea europaea var. sylvestris]|uniref:probable LRR receptor-like serine/threonine-protein kinase At2g16250 isoform X2 n=1 Tax=Olea europaea var. sylvestris TaxID=158386 RepID=UPI000C1CF758|nr:probable LRR receptor-like serine/threonine-protein kinase At2g16250 isoform X2 [Olea europaea var. sylvestris]
MSSTSCSRLGSLSQVGAQGKGIPTGNKTCTDDVYCFGMVLLELVTGKLGISAFSEANLDWLQSALLQMNKDWKIL